MKITLETISIRVFNDKYNPATYYFNNLHGKDSFQLTQNEAELLLANLKILVEQNKKD